MSVYSSNLFGFGTESELNEAKTAKALPLGASLGNHDINLVNFYVKRANYLDHSSFVDSSSSLKVVLRVL